MEKDKPQNNLYFLISFAANLGFSMAIPLVIFIGGGILLDNKLHSSPLFTLIGAVLGIIASAYSLYKTIKPFIGKKDD